MYTRAKKLVGDRNPREEEFSIQMRAMDSDKAGGGVGLAVLVALCRSMAQALSLQQSSIVSITPNVLFCGGL